MQVSETPSGLLVAEQPGDAQAVGKLLRDHDPNLRLIPQPVGDQLLWQVYRYNGPDRDADYVCSWQTPAGEPLPLSARLLDKVQMHDRRTRGEAPDPADLNRRHLERVQKERQSSLDATADDHRPYIDRHRVSVSLGPRPTMHDRL